MTTLPLPLATAFSAAAVLVALGLAAAVYERWFRTRPRQCVRCGCTDDEACAGGCWWYSQRPPICSRCA